ncbi:MAG: tyrosine-type recombinase/integrase, partial [Candidatus Rokuibacteriota bacterium]
VHTFLHSTFELARRRKWVVVNPASDAQVPSVHRREPSPAPAGAIGNLFAAAQHVGGADLVAYLRVSVAAGGRRSEIHGLRWSGVDWDHNRILLRDVVVPAAGGFIIKPRTKTGRPRPVGVGNGTMDLLRRLHARALDIALACGAALPAGAFVFSNDELGAAPWNPSTTARRFTRACVAAGLDPATRLHDLRHLMATHLIDQKVAIPVVSARLGHAQNSTTLDVYTARLAASDREAADVMERLLDAAAVGPAVPDRTSP